MLLCYALLLLFLATANAQVYEILEGSHFNDFMLDVPRNARSASVVAFWNDTEECVNALRELDFNDHGLPSIKHLFVGRFEMSNLRERVWYEFEDFLDLPQRFGVYEEQAKNGVRCPLIAFVPSKYAYDIGEWYLNEPSNEGIKFWNGQGNWRTWLWDQLKLEVRLVNPYPKTIQVSIEPSPNNPFSASSVSIGEDGEQKIEAQTVTLTGLTSHVSVSAYVGDYIYISNPHQEEKIEIPPGIQKIMVKSGHYDALTLDIGQWVMVTDELVRGRHSTTMNTHTRNLLIPPHLPKYTPLGFKLVDMPDELRVAIQEYYINHYHQKAEEWWDTVGTQLNFIDVKTSLISLDHDFEERDRIANELIKPIAEEWSKEPLVFTSFYGVREYFRGSVLRNHIDRVDTHVISAILQVAQTDVDEDWELEVYGWDGKRYQIVLKPGQMALYEGARLIHGRPKPLNGTKFANCFCHFKPIDWHENAYRIQQSQEHNPPNRATLHLDRF